jgi:tetratricopeptide (TPR) repeat protein
MNFLTRTKESFLHKYGELVGLGLLIVFVLAGNIAWIKTDTRIGADFDSKYYMHKTLIFADQLSSRGVSVFFSSLNQLSYANRPPLYQLMSLPFVLLFGHSMDAGILVNLLFWVLLLVSVYNIGTLVRNRLSGLLAAILTAAYPPLVALSRIYRPHFAMAGCVALSLWLLLLLVKTRTVKSVWLFVLSLVFGAYIHPFFVFTLGIPALLISIYILFFQTEPRCIASLRELPGWFSMKLKDRLFLRGFLPALMVAFFLVGSWYLTSGSALYDQLAPLSSKEIVEYRGYEIYAPNVNGIPPSIIWHLLTMPHAISNVLTTFFAVGVLSALLERKTMPIILVVTFIGAYLPLMFLKTLDWLHFLQVLPIVAVITGVWLGGIKNRIALIFWGSVTVLISIFIYMVVTWGISGWGKSMALALGAPFQPDGSCEVNNYLFCPYPARHENWPITDVIETVLNDPGCEKGACDLLISSPDDNFFQPAFLYYRTKDFPESPLSVLSVGGNAFGLNPFSFSALLRSQYIVYQDIEIKKVASNFYLDAAVRLFRSPPYTFEDAHREMAVFNLPDGSKAHLLKRIKPLTLQEAEDVILAVDLPEKYKFQQYEILAPLYAEEGDLVKSLSYYEQALKHDQTPRVRAENLNGMGRVYLSMGRTEEAIVAFQNVLKINRFDFDAHTSLAKIFQDRNDCKVSIPHWEGRLKTNKSVDIYADLGDAYRECGSLNKAIKAFQDALKLEPLNPRAHLGLAMAYASQGQMDAAAREFQEVIQFAPGSEYARQAQEWLENHK